MRFVFEFGYLFSLWCEQSQEKNGNDATVWFCWTIQVVSLFSCKLFFLLLLSLSYQKYSSYNGYGCCWSFCCLTIRILFLDCARCSFFAFSFDLNILSNIIHYNNHGHNNNNEKKNKKNIFFTFAPPLHCHACNAVSLDTKTDPFNSNTHSILVVLPLNDGLAMSTALNVKYCKKRQQKMKNNFIQE